MGPSSLPSRGARAAGLAFFFALVAAAPLPASQRGISTVPGPVLAPGSPAGDLPAYQPPPAFSEDLTIHSMGQTIVMKRAIDHGKTRTDMTVEGMNVVMLEMGDEKGTSYTLLADQKMALKQSRQATEALAAGKGKKKVEEVATSDEAELTPADYEVEDLGDDMPQDRRITRQEGSQRRHSVSAGVA